MKLTYLQALWNSPMFDLFYEFQIFTFLTCIVQCIKMRYKMLNTKLITSTKSSKMIQEVQQLVQIYRILGEIIESFNKVFGYEILLIIFHTGMQLVFCINFALIYLKTTDLHIHIIICNIFYLIVILVSNNCVIIKIKYNCCSFVLYGWCF